MENSLKPSNLYPAYLAGDSKAACYGCLACADMCPTYAINYNADEEGFFYPQLNAELCVKCGKCRRVCPNEITEVTLQYPQQCFAGKINERVDFKKSSSGGAFKSIVKACIKLLRGKYNAFYCAGVKFDEDFQVVNDVVKIDGEDAVDIFSKSKYVQSNPAGIWNKCASIIKDKNNFLIFTGTPCQAAAMKRIIGGADNVLLIDLICHGAPSQSFFDSYRRKMESEFDSKLVFYEFRTKDLLDNGTEYTRSAKYRFANGKEKKVNRLEDSYLIDFYNETFASRPSCDTCSFKRPERCSDITIGDAWRINLVYPELIPQRGLSVVIASSDKSIELIDSIRNEMKVYEISYDFVKENNEPLKLKK